MNKINYKLLLAVVFVMLVRGSASAQGGLFYNVKAFGANGDGKAIDSKAIDSAINAAASAGGGTVFLPAGNYLSGTIHLKSNIAIYLDAGATLIAATPAEGAKYDLPEKNANEIYQDYGHCHFHNSLIVGENLENISILGPGRIWGRGLLRTSEKNTVNDGFGNKTISLKLCHNVILRDFSVLTGGWFVLLLNAVDNITIDNLKMDTNRDGMDVISCKNVRISNCFVNSPNDDGIVLKCDYALNYARALENVNITNCEVSGYNEGTMLDGTFVKNGKHDNGSPIGRIKLGTESNGGYKNITISNCVFDHCRGLCLETVDGAQLEDVTINNITMRDVMNSPIFVRLGERMRGPAGTPVGELRRVVISNIVAYDVDAKQGVLICGDAGHNINDLTLSNIHIYYRGGGTKEQSLRTVPGYEKAYPEPGTFGVTPAYGFFVRYVSDLKMSDIDVSFMKDDFRPAFVLDNVSGADFQHVRAQTTAGTPTFMLNTVKNFNVYNSPGIPDTKLTDVDKKVF